MPLMRTEIGEVLRGVRSAQHRTLRDVAKQANVSLGYLSEVERGQKEPSSELLEAICQALGLPLWALLREVSNRMVLRAQFYVPDTVPDDLLDSRTIRIVPDARTESRVALKA
ncbi:MAG: helix-turn-helix transcriptional regulator [Varibaculum sp.]|nr:helix-turn-helix transcriptional regulator [Varibaculum sp.]